MTSTHYDVVIIGGGHNGLTCGAYLAKGGKNTLVLESRQVIGGAEVSRVEIVDDRFQDQRGNRGTPHYAAFDAAKCDFEAPN